MFEFLGQVAQAAAPISSIIGSIRGITGSGSSKVRRPQIPESERYALSMYKALTEPGNSLLAALTEEEYRGGVGEFLSKIRGLENANRRARSLGRRPAFFTDPERRDEALNFMISRGLPTLRERARQAAMDRMTASAGGSKTFAAAQGTRDAAYRAALAEQREAQEAARTQGIGDLTGGIQDIIDIFRGGGGYDPRQGPPPRKPMQVYY